MPLAVCAVATGASAPRHAATAPIAAMARRARIAIPVRAPRAQPCIAVAGIRPILPQVRRRAPTAGAQCCLASVPAAAIQLAQDGFWAPVDLRRPVVYHAPSGRGGLSSIRNQIMTSTCGSCLKRWTES